MQSYNIAIIPGDGTGPEVTAEAMKVLGVAAEKFGFKLDTTEYDFGGERYMRTGETLPESGLEELRRHQAILLGAIGHPEVKPGILEKGILLALRFAFDQYINLRPVRLYPGERFIHLVLLQLDQPAKKPYRGSYQDQRGVRLPKIFSPREA